MSDIDTLAATADCTGASDCAATVHVHGCYADRGSCDEPREHSDIDTLAATVERLEGYGCMREASVGRSCGQAYRDGDLEVPRCLRCTALALVEHARTLERERDEALRKAPAYDRARALVELADVAESRAIVRAVAAEARADRYEKALREIAEMLELPEGTGSFSAAMRDLARAALAGEDA